MGSHISVNNRRYHVADAEPSIGFTAIVFAAGIMLAILESSLGRLTLIGGVRPDFAVLVVVLATCRMGFGRAMILAFALGLTRDFYSGGVYEIFSDEMRGIYSQRVFGIHAFSLTFMAYLMIAAQDYLMTSNWRGQFVVVFVGSSLYGFLVLFLKLIIGYATPSPVQIMGMITCTAVYTAALGPFLFKLTQKPQTLPYLRLKMKHDAEDETALPQTEV